MSKNEITIKEYIDMQIKDVKADIKEIKDILNDFIKRADGKYASKWVEKGVIWGIIFLITTLVGMVGYFFDKVFG